MIALRAKSPCLGCRIAGALPCSECERGPMIRCRRGTTAPPNKRIIDFVDQGHQGGRSGLCDSPRAVSPPSTMTARSGSSMPMYNQFVFALDRGEGASAPASGVEDKEPFKSVLAGDMKAVAAMGEKGMLEIVAATHSGMTTVDFNKTVKDWLETAKHPRFKSALYRSRLPADAGAARLSPRQRLQDLHRLRRRRRVHARLRPRRPMAFRRSR